MSDRRRCRAPSVDELREVPAEAARDTLRQLTAAAQDLIAPSRTTGLMRRLFPFKSSTRRSSRGRPSPLQGLRLLIRWSRPSPRITVIIWNPSLVSKQVLADAGLAGAALTDLSLFKSRRGALRRPQVVAFEGKITTLIEAARGSTLCMDLMILPSEHSFTDLLDALRATAERSPSLLKLPNIAILINDSSFFRRAWYHNRTVYEATFATSIVCITSNIVYFSFSRVKGHQTGMGALESLVTARDAFALGSLVAVHEGARLQFIVNGFHAASARTAATIRIVRSLLSDLREGAKGDGDEKPPDRFFLVVQGGDCVMHQAPSVGYGKRYDDSPAVRLIADPFFFDSDGYQITRRAVFEKRLPDWGCREDVVFWRGSATNRGVSPIGEAISRLEQVPRVAMCIRLKGEAKTDVAIMSSWGFQFPHEAAQQYLMDAGVYGPAISILQHARYRYLIDIDGVANAWGFFEKLMLGSCILKVSSPFEQWFYKEVKEWEHFVPVREDLSDLIEKIRWCREHGEQARMIGEAGQKFAISHTCEIARRMAIQALRDCLIPLR